MCSPGLAKRAVGQCERVNMFHTKQKFQFSLEAPLRKRQIEERPSRLNVGWSGLVAWWLIGTVTEAFSRAALQLRGRVRSTPWMGNTGTLLLP